MKNNRLKLSLAAFGLMVAMLGSTAISLAQTTPLCQWDNKLEICKPTAPNGYCAVSGPNCDGPVVE